MECLLKEELVCFSPCSYGLVCYWSTYLTILGLRCLICKIWSESMALRSLSAIMFENSYTVSTV